MKNMIHRDFFRNHLLVMMGLLLFNFSAAQSFQEENKKLNRETNKLLREAEEKLEEEDFSSAEASYRTAVSKNSENVTARYNMANMYYGKEKPEHAVKRYNQAAKLEESKEGKHKIFHNMGNSFMEQKDYARAVEAYKNALRNVPSDEETRYNLALAKKMLEEEEPEGGGDDDQDQDQDDQNEDQQDEGDQDQDEEGGENENEGGDENDDSEQQPQEEDENGDPKDEQEQEGEQGGEEEQQPQQPQPGQLSPQQIQSLLEAMNNEEKKVQDKINAEKAKGAKTRTGKDW